MFIIGDPGSTHGGSLAGCIEAVDVAVEAKLDAIKFQLFEGNNNGNIELPRQHWKEIVGYAKGKIEIFASVFDLEAIDLLIESGIKKAKLAYSQNFNLKLIKKLKENDFEIWASGDDEKYPHYANKRFFCIPEYPPKKMAIGTMPTAWNGLSSHFLGYNIEKTFMKDSGWEYLEKHFHTNTRVECPDYYIALSPKELKEMITCLKTTKLTTAKSLNSLRPNFPITGRN